MYEIIFINVFYEFNIQKNRLVTCNFLLVTIYLLSLPKSFSKSDFADK